MNELKTWKIRDWTFLFCTIYNSSMPCMCKVHRCFYRIYLKSPSLKRLYQFNERICLVSRLALNLIQRLLTKRRSHTIILQGDRIELVGAFSYWWDTRDFRCWKRRRGSNRKEAWVEGRPPGETAVQTAVPAPAFSRSTCLNGYWRGQIKGLVIMVRENKEKDLGGDLMRQGLGFPWLSMTTIVF